MEEGTGAVVENLPELTDRTRRYFAGWGRMSSKAEGTKGDGIPEEVYVVRSAEFEPIHYAAVPTLEEAKAVIAHLEEKAEAMERFDEGFDYDVVPYFASAPEAIAGIDQEDES